MGSVTKERSLSGVAHDIAHHAGSGLSCLMPHLAKALPEASLKTTAVELLDEEPYPAGISEIRPLRLALGDLKQTALGILKKYGFEIAPYRRNKPSVAFSAAISRSDPAGSKAPRNLPTSGGRCSRPVAMLASSGIASRKAV